LLFVSNRRIERSVAVGTKLCPLRVFGTAIPTKWHKVVVCYFIQNVCDQSSFLIVHACQASLGLRRNYLNEVFDETSIKTIGAVMSLVDREVLLKRGINKTLAEYSDCVPGVEASEKDVFDSILQMKKNLARLNPRLDYRHSARSIFVKPTL
jgi:hypothetical protein